MVSAPPELRPDYRSAAASAPIPLWSGPLHFKRDAFAVKGSGTLSYEWRPSPRLRFRFRSSRPPSSTPPDVGKLVLWGARARATARLWQLKLSAATGAAPTFSYDGLLTAPLERGTKRGFGSVVFHLLNYPDFLGKVITSPTGRRTGRVEADFAGWHLTLDNLAETRELRGELQRDGGFAITHVGELRRAAGEAFGGTSVSAIRDDLGMALSFARGGWSQPTLLVGRDSSGTVIWERWDDIVQSPFVYRHSWLDPLVRNSLDSLIPGFIGRSLNPLWRDPMRRATVLYVDANQQSRVEVSLVLAQVALELLAWALLVLDKQVVSRGDFDKSWDAARRIRELLAHLGIPVAVPSSLTALAGFAGPPPPGDGPQRITYIRNRIVHPPRRLPASWPDLAPAVEAEYLSLEFLELALLRLSGYRGRYWSRCSGTTNAVPWP